MNYLIETYGCQMNAAESAALKKVFDAAGWAEAADLRSVDLVLINTCAVRESAEQRFLARLAIYAARKKARAKTATPLYIALAGCAAQRLGNALQEKGADFVLGAFAKKPLEKLLAGWNCAREVPPPNPQCQSTDTNFYTSYYVPGSRICSVPIMNGCNNFCSYCIVPYLRGPEISRPPSEILSEIQSLAQKNVSEITLLGQNVLAYKYEGIDFASLALLIAGSVAGTSIRWVRFLSSHPKDMSPQVIKVLADNQCFCRHLHLPVQHGSNKILAAMNRRTTREGYLALVRELRAAMPSLTLSTDILVGFPGETEQDLDETLSLMEEARFLTAYMYYYNPREGTAAYSMSGGIEPAVKKARLARIIDAQSKRTASLLKERLGSRVLVLADAPSRRNKNEMLCRTERNESVVVETKGVQHGDFIEAALEELAGNTFRARLAG